MMLNKPLTALLALLLWPLSAQAENVQVQPPATGQPSPQALEAIGEQLDFQQYLENKAYIPVQMADDEIKLVPRHLVNAAHIPVAASPAMAAWVPASTASSQRIKTLENRVEQLETLIKTQTALLIELSKKIDQEP